MDFIRDVMQHTFLQHALLAGLLSSVACGVVGTYVVVRRITYIAGAISHCILGGMGAAQYMQAVHGWSWCDPLFGATISALLAALVIGLVSLKAKQREDTVIGAIWAIGMAVGVIFIANTPGYNKDLTSYLFGNILWVSSRDLWLIAILNCVVLVTVFTFYNQFLAVCFDEEFSRLRGVPVELFYLLLLALTALTVVVMVKVVGIVLVIALLTLPVAIAGNYVRTLWQMMLLSIVVSALLTVCGQALTYSPTNVKLPAGATIIVLAGIVYLISVAIPRRAR